MVRAVSSDPNPPECLSCGACCFSRLPDYVRVTGEDYARLGAEADALTHFVGNRCFMKMSGGHCAALRIDGARAQFFCSVYETRPETCRALERGSAACSAERYEKSVRAQRAAAETTASSPSTQEPQP